MYASKGKEDRTRLDGFETEIFKLVKKQATSEQWKQWLRAPLEHAAASGNMDLFTRLMDAGADGSAGWRGYLGRTLLGAAARGKNEKMVLALLKAGAKDDIDVVFEGDRCFPRGTSALCTAAYWGAEAVGKALLIAGANPTLPDSSGFTPLHVAARGGCHGLIDYLVLAGADPNAVTRASGSRGFTPLQLAAFDGDEQCVSALLLAGADKNTTKGKSGKSPLTLAVEAEDAVYTGLGNHLGVVKTLLAAGARIDVRPREVECFLMVGSDDLGVPSDLSRAAFLGHVAVLEALMRHGSKASGEGATGDNNATALHFAAAFEGPGDNGNTVRALLTAGSDVEAKLTATADGSTPLHIAASREIASIGTILALLEGGANVNALDASQSTPLHKACSRSCGGAVELLLRWGADETLEDGDGQTASGVVGNWEFDHERDCPEDSDEHLQQRGVDNGHVLHMLARAPADRSWRRRGWLVLYRSYPSKVQLSADCRIDNDAEMGEHAGRDDDTSKVVRPRLNPADGSDGRVGGKGAENEAMVDFARLVGRMVDMETECVFRLVVGYL